MRTRLLYGLPILALGLMWNMTGLYYLKFATDVLGLAPAWVGGAFAAGRLWDALSDPLAGHWSDRTRTRMGRRRPWMLASALPLGVAFAALWMPPASLRGTPLLVWEVCALLLLYTAVTAFRVPHLALGAELARAPRERGALFATSAAMDAAGGLAGVAVLILAVRAGADPRSTFSLLAAIVALAAVVFVVASSLGLREPEPSAQSTATAGRALRDVWANRPARRWLFVDMLRVAGLVCAMTTVPYAAEYVLGDPARLGPLMLAFALPMFLGQALWPSLCARLGARRLFTVALAIEAAALGSLFFAPSVPFATVLGVCALAGLCDGAAGTSGKVIEAGLIDRDTAHTGEHRAGTYFAAWNLGRKTSLAAAVAVVGGSLQAAGFEAGGVQPEGARAAILALVSVVPAVLVALAVAALNLRRWPGTRRDPLPQHERTKRGLGMGTTNRSRLPPGGGKVTTIDFQLRGAPRAPPSAQ